MPKSEKEYLGKVKLFRTPRLYAVVLEPIPEKEFVETKLAQVTPTVWPYREEDNALVTAYAIEDFGNETITPERAFRSFGRTVARFVEYELIKPINESPPPQTRLLHEMAINIQDEVL